MLICFVILCIHIELEYIYISTNLISKLADENIFHHIPLLLGITLTNWESRDFARQRVMGVRQWSWGNHQLSIASCHSKMYLHSIYSNIIYICDYLRYQRIGNWWFGLVGWNSEDFWRHPKATRQQVEVLRQQLARCDILCLLPT